MVRDKAGRPPGELGVSKVSKSMECDIFASSALTLFVIIIIITNVLI